jgi:hypothetical protein
MTTLLQKKVGFKEGMRAILIDAPPEAVEALNFPAEALSNQLRGTFNYIHVFVKSQQELDATFPELKKHLNDRGMLWVSWPKAGRLGTDLNLKHVIRIGYSHGLVESKTVSVDAKWSAIKFTFPIEGKQYNNSYGQLE